MKEQKVKELVRVPAEARYQPEAREGGRCVCGRSKLAHFWVCSCGVVEKSESSGFPERCGTHRLCDGRSVLTCPVWATALRIGQLENAGHLLGEEWMRGQIDEFERDWLEQGNADLTERDRWILRGMLSYVRHQMISRVGKERQASMEKDEERIETRQIPEGAGRGGSDVTVQGGGFAAGGMAASEGPGGGRVESTSSTVGVGGNGSPGAFVASGGVGGAGPGGFVGGRAESAEASTVVSEDGESRYAATLRRERELEEATDVRIRAQAEWNGVKYRVIAPGAVRKHSAVYLNGKLVVEKSETDALKNERWVTVGELRSPVGAGVLEEVDDMGCALYVLLAGRFNDRHR